MVNLFSKHNYTYFIHSSEIYETPNEERKKIILLYNLRVFTAGAFETQL
jgi:hypothetical protein